MAIDMTAWQKQRNFYGERALDFNDGKMCVTVALSTEMEARDGMVLLPSGVRVIGESVPMLWVHGFDFRGFLPMGSVRNFRAEVVDGQPDALVGEKYYYSPSEAVAKMNSEVANLPTIVYDMKKQGHFRGVSVGWKGIAAEMRAPRFPWPGRDPAEPVPTFTEWELVELSDCHVPVDPLAVDKAFRSLIDGGKLTEKQLEELIGRECQHCGRCGSDPQQVPVKASSGLDIVALALQTVKPKEG
jgi:hypothetical protein